MVSLVFHDVAKDIGYNLRQLRKSLGFTLTAVVSLALGIGATTAMFSLIYAVLIHPYPYAGADRMVNPVAKNLTLPAGMSLPFSADWFRLTGPQLQIFRHAKAIDDVEGFDWTRRTVTGEDLPESVSACFNTANITSFMKVAPLLGRDILPSDAPAGKPAEPVLVLSYLFWQRHYGGDRSIVGRLLQLDHVNYTIIGVRSARNTFGGSDVNLPAQITNDPKAGLIPYIKLKPGVSLTTANAEFQALLEQFAKETPDNFPKKFRVDVQRLIDPVVQAWGARFSLLFAAVVLLLLIGCANCSILLLARGTARQHELSLRAALGASRARIVRQLLTESLIRSFSGCALGILLAYWLPQLPLKWVPSLFASESAVELNLPVLCFSVAAALVTGVLFGLLPALRLSKLDVIHTIHASSRRATAGTGAKGFHIALVAGQIAITLLLLAGATAACAGFFKLLRADLGFNPENTHAIDIPLHANSYTSWKQRAVYFEQLRQGISSVPGVLDVALAGSGRPPTNAQYGGAGFEIVGQAEKQSRQAGVSLVGENYFSLLRIPLLQGRLWSAHEVSHGARFAIVNKTFAAKYWPAGDALGQRIRIPDFKSMPPFLFTPPESDGMLRIIGVVSDARNNGLLRPVKPAIYLPYTRALWPGAQMLVRTQGPSLTLLHAIRTAVRSMDAQQEVASNPLTLNEWIRQEPEWGQEHVVSVFFGVFAMLALTLAAAGLYSVVSYSVTQRTNEFGVRVALGAQATDIFWLVLRSTMISVGIGIGAGILLIMVSNKLIGQWVEGSVRNPEIVLAVTCLLTLVAALASSGPARRALSVDPIQALRHD